MEERADTIAITFTKAYDVSGDFASPPPGPGSVSGGASAPSYTRHFTQTEDYFIRFPDEYRTPRFRIHHDYRVREPRKEYLAALEETFASLMPKAPDVFAGLTYFFDPQEIFKPCFYRLYRTDEALFLYLLRLDFGYRPHYQTIVDRGDNDVTHVARTRELFLEPLLIPLARAEYEGDRLVKAVIRPLFSETWIGEYGRGYRVQGVWMDNDLTKFFTRLFTPPDRRLYPYYPFLCKYRTVCASPAGFTEGEREALASYLDRALGFLHPVLSGIQDALKGSSFSEELSIFRVLRPRVGELGPQPGPRVRIRVYLTPDGLKEYQIEEDTPSG
jgi:hypothetical protein